MSHTSIARIENGETSPTLKVFIELANQLGYDLILQDLNIEDEENELTTAINNAGYDIINENINDDILVLKRKKILEKN